MADAYFRTSSAEALRSLPFLEEYSMEHHKKHYKAIKHIQVRASSSRADALPNAELSGHAAHHSGPLTTDAPPPVPAGEAAEVPRPGGTLPRRTGHGQDIGSSGADVRE
jgi:hypothetical protein